MPPLLPFEISPAQRPVKNESMTEQMNRATSPADQAPKRGNESPDAYAQQQDRHEKDLRAMLAPTPEVSFVSLNEYPPLSRTTELILEINGVYYFYRYVGGGFFDFKRKESGRGHQPSNYALPKKSESHIHEAAQRIGRELQRWGEIDVQSD